MTEFAQSSATYLVDHNWAKMEPPKRMGLLKELAPLFPVTYSRFEEAQFRHLSLQPSPDSLPVSVQGHLFMAATPGGFSKDQVITVLEDAANSYQG